MLKSKVRNEEKIKNKSCSSQPQLNFSLKLSLSSTSTITSTQYSCDIKATQSCHISKTLGTTIIAITFEKGYSFNLLEELVTEKSKVHLLFF